MVKHLPAMQETWVQSLGWKDPLEKEMATHSSILAWRIPWTKEAGWLATVHGVSELDMIEQLAHILNSEGEDSLHIIDRLGVVYLSTLKYFKCQIFT